MKNRLICVCSLIFVNLTLAASAGPQDASAPSAPAAAKPAEKLPVAAFGQLPFVEHAEISPDGTHWAGLLGIGGSQVVAILNLFDKKEKIVRMSVPDGTQVRWLRWVNADNVMVGVDALQAIEASDWYISRTIALNRISGKLTLLLWDLGGQNAGEVLWWPHGNSNEVLISGQNSIYEGEDWWPAVYQVNVTNGHQRVVVHPRAGVADWAADGDGTVRVGVGYDDSRLTSRLVYRPAGSRESFHTVDRADARKGEILLPPFMFLPGGDHALVIHDNEQMYDRMRKAGKSVEFVSLPLADHYYTRQADRIALLTAMEKFLERYNPAD